MSVQPGVWDVCTARCVGCLYSQVCGMSVQPGVWDVCTSRYIIPIAWLVNTTLKTRDYVAYIL